MDLLDYLRTTRFGLYMPQLIEESAGFHFGTLIAQPSMFEEKRMPYEAIPILIFLTISLLSGLGLIGDALRRAIHDLGRGNRDLHPQAGPEADLSARRQQRHKSEGESMRKHFKESLTDTTRNPEPLKTPPTPNVRYVGFESIEGGRRLRFSVKSAGHESVEFTIEISDAAFIGARGISIQDAAPMAYEKIVEMLVTQNVVDSNQLFLTDADIAKYIVRHLSSQKRAASMSNGRRWSDIAA